jgi:hypothetical protein
VSLLVVNDLTRFEGFIRTASSAVLVEALVADVLGPMFASLEPAPVARARVISRRWENEPDAALRAAGRLLADS